MAIAFDCTFVAQCTEHNMDFVMRLCSHVVVLDSGRLLVEGTAGLVREHPMVLEAYLGGAGAAHG